VFKLIVLLKKKDNITEEEFTRHWLNTHVPLAKTLPGVRRYVVNLVKKPPNREPDFHGVVELWFDDVASMKKAFASPAGQVTQQDSHKFTSSVSTLFVEERQLI
jgi:uncharacterized protein (TIGR02118 family)